MITHCPTKVQSICIRRICFVVSKKILQLRNINYFIKQYYYYYYYYCPIKLTKTIRYDFVYAQFIHTQKIVYLIAQTIDINVSIKI